MKFEIKSTGSPGCSSRKEEKHCSMLLYCSRYVRVRTSGDSGAGCGG